MSSWGTQTTLQFVDPETLNEVSNVLDPLVDPIFISPVGFGERSVSQLIWPSLQLTPEGTLEVGDTATLYVRSLSLTPGPEDNALQLSTISVLGDLLTVPNLTTLDVRGGVIYLADMKAHPKFGILRSRAIGFGARDGGTHDS